MITTEELEAKKTEAGGYTRDQLREWGIPWPPLKGWKVFLTTGEWPEIEVDEVADFRRDMTTVELHDLFRNVVLAIVVNGHASDLYEYPEVLAYFGAQNPINDHAKEAK